MTALSAQEIEDYGAALINPFSGASLTSQGYDLTLGKIEEFVGSGIMGKEGKVLPEYREVERFPTSEGEAYWLGPGAYLVTFAETVNIPHDIVGLLWSRSTLLRMGAGFSTAVWDAGYHGIGQSMLVVLNPWGIQVPIGGRVGQMVFFRLGQETEQPYDGQYQGGKSV